MARRLSVVLCVLAALAFASAAAGGGGAKFKVGMSGYSLICDSSCNFDTVVITRVDDNRQPPCHLTASIGTGRCRWTAPPGTTMVLEISSAMPDGTFTWGGDCASTGPTCKLVVDSNKSVFITAHWA